MKKLAAICAVLALVAVMAQAQDEPKTVSLAVYGQNGSTAVSEIEKSLGVHAKYVDVDSGDLDMPCVVAAKDLPGEDAASLASFATGFNLQLEGDRGVLRVGLPGESVGGGSVKGYDVSVLAGMYVEYVNNWGAPKRAPAKGEEPEPELTAAEHLANLIEDALYDLWDEEYAASVVGDRVLFTLHAAGHRRVRELLDILLKEKGGESTALQRERSMMEKLKSTKLTTEYEATPISSVLAGICMQAGVGLVLGPNAAAECVDYHVKLSFEDTTCWDALQKTLDVLREEDMEIQTGARAGAFALGLDGELSGNGYRVFPIADLLKKLNASYERQRTKGDKEDGYSGGLREEGGNRVVVDALYDLLEATGRSADCFVYGDRLLVRGSADTIDAAMEILEQMGWEKPKD